MSESVTSLAIMGHMFVFSGHTTENNGHYNGHESKIRDTLAKIRVAFPKIRGRASENKGHLFRKIRVTLFGNYELHFKN